MAPPSPLPMDQVYHNDQAYVEAEDGSEDGYVLSKKKYLSTEDPYDFYIQEDELIYNAEELTVDYIYILNAEENPLSFNSW